MVGRIGQWSGSLRIGWPKLPLKELSGQSNTNRLGIMRSLVWARSERLERPLCARRRYSPKMVRRSRLVKGSWRSIAKSFKSGEVDPAIKSPISRAARKLNVIPLPPYP